jgi:hypothetical protein
MFERTRDTTRASGSNRFAERPTVSGSARQNLGHRHKKAQEILKYKFAESTGADMVKKKLLGNTKMR